MTVGVLQMLTIFARRYVHVQAFRLDRQGRLDVKFIRV